MIEDIESLNITKGKAVKWFLIIVVSIVGIGIVGSYAGLLTKAVTAPAKVLSKTLDTDNVIHNYEWFYDVNASFESRLGQVKQFKELYETETDKEERQRLRIDFAAMKQTCRDLATKYNANSEKMNRSIFKGWSLPESLSMEVCG